MGPSSSRHSSACTSRASSSFSKGLSWWGSWGASLLLGHASSGRSSTRSSDMGRVHLQKPLQGSADLFIARRCQVAGLREQGREPLPKRIRVQLRRNVLNRLIISLAGPLPLATPASQAIPSGVNSSTSGLGGTWLQLVHTLRQNIHSKFEFIQGGTFISPSSRPLCTACATGQRVQNGRAVVLHLAGAGVFGTMPSTSSALQA